MRIDYNHNYYFVVKQYDYFFDILLFFKSKKRFNSLVGEASFQNNEAKWAWSSKLIIDSEKDNILKFIKKAILNKGFL